MPRFVLLEHRWNGVHWDFMLERPDGSALRTWALDAPVVSGRAVAARALDDHRAAYLDYEGDVSGGRGSVRRVDRGEYETLVWTPDSVRVRLSGGQLAGPAEVWRVGEGESAGGGVNWTFRFGNFD